MQPKSRDELKKELARRKKQNKRIVIRAFAVIVILSVLGITYATCINFISTGFFEDVINEPPKYYFYEPDYEYNIFEDPDYADTLNSDAGKIHYSSDDRCFTSVEEDDFESYGDAAELMFELVTAIRNGDSDGYNACFSDSAIKDFRKDKFTMQRIYDIKIIFVETVNAKDDKGSTYQLSRISLEYKINRNDGTFTKDIGSNMSAKQTFWISENNPSGRALIDDVDTEYILSSNLPTELNAVRIVAASAIVASVTALSVFAAVIVINKTATDEKRAEIKARKDKKREVKAQKEADSESKGEDKVDTDSSQNSN